MDRKTLLEELRVYGVKNNVPNITGTNAHFLSDIIFIKNAKNILEIGTANGFSTIYLGMAVEKNNGQVTSIEFSSPSYKQAQNNIEKAGLENTVVLLFGDALDIIPDLDSGFDFVFIDGMMKSSVAFLQAIWYKVELGGIIIIDDVIKFKKKMIGLDTFLDSNNIKYNILPIDVDDGVMMIIKQDILINN